MILKHFLKKEKKTKNPNITLGCDDFKVKYIIPDFKADFLTLTPKILLIFSY